MRAMSSDKAPYTRYTDCSSLTQSDIFHDSFHIIFARYMVVATCSLDRCFVLTAVQSRKAVSATAYFTSKQILPFGIEEQYTALKSRGVWQMYTFNITVMLFCFPHSQLIIYYNIMSIMLYHRLICYSYLAVKALPLHITICLQGNS